MLRSGWIALFTTVGLSLMGCQSMRPRHQSGLVSYSGPVSLSAEKIPCKKMVDDYCDALYSPEALGNLVVQRPKGPIEILQGETSNDFSQADFHYFRAKLRNRSFLPSDFLSSLQAENYFNKLSQFLKRTPRKFMSLSQRLSSERDEFELDAIWTAAIRSTVIARMNRVYPGYHQLGSRQIPPEYSIEWRKIRLNLVAEISRAIWNSDKNWKKVEASFSELQEAFVRTIKKLEIAPSIREDWIGRIKEVALVLPGSLPEISDEDCSATQSNAYYYKYLNVITVCAGDFNSEDIMQTLAHEMAHALDIDRSQYLFKTRSDFGIAHREYRKQACQEEGFSCEDWKKYKDHFGRKLESLTEFEPQLWSFNQCLKKSPSEHTLTPRDYEDVAKKITDRRFSTLASQDRFLTLIKTELPLKNGKPRANPFHFNPCAYYSWVREEEPIDDELTSLIFFSSEYRCSKEKTSAKKFKNAIDLSHRMTAALIRYALAVEGEFSSREAMEREGLASSPVERFADVLGSYAFAEYLKSVPDLSDRRTKFLAGNSWQCSEPSLSSQFPEESAIEKNYVSGAYSEGVQRRQELLSDRIRDVLGCSLDFQFKACTLPFKSP
jgi:hypothetical protein